MLPAELDLKTILELDQAGFEKMFTNSAIYRLGLEYLKRNAALCLANRQSKKEI